MKCVQNLKNFEVIAGSSRSQLHGEVLQFFEGYESKFFIKLLLEELREVSCRIKGIGSSDTVFVLLGETDAGLVRCMFAVQEQVPLKGFTKVQGLSGSQ